MIVELERGDFERARPLFQELDFHLAVGAVLGGSIPGKVFVDDAKNPQSGLAWTNRRFHLAGNAGNRAFNRAAARLFAGTVYPALKEAGTVAFSLYYDGERWERTIPNQILKDKHLDRAQRQYYLFQEIKNDWRAMLPPGYEIQYVDELLLANRQLQNLERLEEELCSERESVEAFLANSFGACLVHEGSLVAWCLSEYNHASRCEIGIETVEDYRRRGFATLTASALVEHALARGIREIGWHCFDRNAASGAAARAIGFDKQRDYPAYIAWIQDAGEEKP